MKIKIPQFRTENGRKIFTIEARVDAYRRPAGRSPVVPVKTGTQNQNPENLDPGSGSGVTTLAGEAPVNPDEVRVRFRLLSEVDAYPTMGWLGPQLVRYGHLNGQAIRQLPELINNRAKPVPLMWNHSFDIHDKAGRVDSAEIEESTDIPPGVNGDLVVNRNYDGKAAVGLETGELDATSICVHFEMEMSHPDMDFEMFWDLAGDVDMPHEVDGQIVAWLPTAANEVYHHALVWAGADSNSGPRNEGPHPNPLPEGEGGAANVGAVHEPATTENNIEEGGRGMWDKVKLMMAAVLATLGIDAVLGDKGEVPEGLHERVTEKLKGLLSLRDQYNALASKLQALEKPLLKEKETSLSAAEIVDRLPAALELAAHGLTYITDLRNEALKWFDSAKVDPGKAELSKEAKEIRAVIEACSHVGQLKAYVAQYRQEAEARFGPQGDRRSSAGQEPPGSPAAGGANAEISASAKRLFPE